MAFLALRFETDAEHADAWSDALLDAGALSVDVSDPGEGTPDESPLYGEPGHPTAAAWPRSRIVTLFGAGADAPAALATAAHAIGVPPPAHEITAVAEEDWVRQTQAQFGPIEIVRGFWVVPSWSIAPDPQALNLRLDPGLAFGTGSHATTRLCLQWLHAHIGGGEALLDYGCGSGILAIAALRLGAASAIGTDIDPQAIRASQANASLNEVAASFAAPDALDRDVYDIVIANILANPLIMLAPALANRVCGGGRIALSGILDDQVPAVTAAYARWFTLAPWRQQDGWTLLCGVRAR